MKRYLLAATAVLALSMPAFAATQGFHSGARSPANSKAHAPAVNPVASVNSGACGDKQTWDEVVQISKGYADAVMTDVDATKNAAMIAAVAKRVNGGFPAWFNVGDVAKVVFITNVPDGLHTTVAFFDSRGCYMASIRFMFNTWDDIAKEVGIAVS